MKKGMSMTLTIIVAAVVILVTALVILTIFGTGIVPVASIAEAKNNCRLQGEQLCKSTSNLPPTWNLNTMLLEGNPTSCAILCGSGTEACDDYKWKSAKCGYTD